MKSDNKFEQIEKYLDGSLSQEERLRFEDALLENEALREEVEFQRNMETILANQPEDALRHNLQKLDEKYANPPNSFRKIWLGGLLFVLLIGLVLWFLPDNSTKQPSRVIEPVEKKIKEDIPKEELSKEIEKVPIETVEKEEKIEKEEPIKKQLTTPKQKSKPQQKKEVKPQPIAADFAPIEILEKRLGNLRGGELEVDGVEEVYKLKNGQINFTINGTIAIENDIDESAVTLHIFNNKMADYENFKPVFSENLTFEKSNELFISNLQKQLSIKAGLYYLQIENEMGEILFLGKFLIKL